MAQQSMQLWSMVALAVEVLFIIKMFYLALSNRSFLMDGAVRTVSGLRRFLCGARALKENPVIAEKIDRERMRMCHIYMYVVLSTMLPSVLSVQRNLALASGEDFQQIASEALRWLMLFFLAVATLHLFFPQALTPQSAEILYLVLMAACIFSISPLLEPTYSSTTSVLASFVCRIPAVVLTRRLWLVGLTNCGFLFAAMPQAPQSAMALELPVLLLVWAMGLTAHIFVRQSVEKALLRREESTGRKVATALLHLICDAVIELDESFRLTHDSKELSAILLRDRPGSTLAGVKFSDFTASPLEARQALANLDQVPSVPGDLRSAEEVMASAFHTRLVDSCCSKFRTEVFHVKYRKADGDLYHLLGLRDFTDQKSLAREQHISLETAPAPATGQPDPPGPAGSSSASRYELQNSDLAAQGLSQGQDMSTARTVLLYLNENGIVESASMAAACVLGVGLPELLPGPGATLLQEYSAKERAKLARPRVSSQPAQRFREMQVQWSPGTVELVEVIVEVLCTKQGTLRLLLRCPAPSLQAPPPSGASGCPQPLSVIPGTVADRVDLA